MYLSRYMPTDRLNPGPEPRLNPLEYPSDSYRPVVESSAHLDFLIDAYQPLESHFKRREDVSIHAFIMAYYVEGNPFKPVSPDLFVAFGPWRDRRRDVWKTWEEGKLADFILEMTSFRRKTRDDVYKPVLYRRLGVTEYWQYDVKGNYLDPPLKGRRLNAEGKYQPIPLSTSPGGTLYGTSKVLDLHLCLADNRLRFLDATTGEFLLTGKEMDQVLAIQDEQLRLLDEQRRLQEEERHLLEERLRIALDNDITSHAAIEAARA